MALKPPFKVLASLRLAVFVILSLAVIAAIGTFTEARYNSSEMAQKLVYESVWMYAAMGLLCVNLTAVMIDRWPWKQHHAGFVLAHVGIMILLLGSLITQKFGIDGSMYFEFGQQRNTVTVKDRDLSVYASLDGSAFRSLFHADTDFLRHPPSEKNPYVIHLGSDELKIVKFLPFAFRQSEIEESKLKQDGPAIRFELQNPNVNLTQWVRREDRQLKNEIDLGPAKVILASDPVPPDGRNEVVVINHGEAARLDYIIYNKDNTIRKKGHIQQSETIDTGWMGMQFRLLRFLPHSKEQVSFQPAAAETKMTTSALQFQFGGETYWLGLDSALKLFMADHMFVMTYGHKRLDLNFPIRLDEFHMDHYQGTDHPASYASRVFVPGRGEVTISMNEPLKFKGFTFYQSSFENDPMTGKPTASILSVNRDPGRWIKYLGSMLIVFGCIVLFYFKRVQWLSSLRSKK